MPLWTGHVVDHCRFLRLRSYNIVQHAHYRYWVQIIQFHAVWLTSGYRGPTYDAS